MVVKPLDFVVRGKRGLVQPAVKCRGPEYLRIIYGPEYDAPENLERLRSAGWRPSGRWRCASSRWASRRWSGSSAASRCGACTSACSACWRWRASRSIRGCSRLSDLLRPSRHLAPLVHGVGAASSITMISTSLPMSAKLGQVQGLGVHTGLDAEGVGHRGGTCRFGHRTTEGPLLRNAGWLGCALLRASRGRSDGGAEPRMGLGVRGFGGSGVLGFGVRGSGFGVRGSGFGVRGDRSGLGADRSGAPHCSLHSQGSARGLPGGWSLARGACFPDRERRHELRNNVSKMSPATGWQEA